MKRSTHSNCAASPEASLSEPLPQVRGYGARLLRKSKPYWVPLLGLDCLIIYYFSLHISFVQAANSMVQAIGNYHPMDPRADAVIAAAQEQLAKSVLSLLAAAGGAMLCIGAVIGLCWSARCHRRSRRVAAEIGGTLWVEGKGTAVTAVDMSEQGCRIRLSTPLASGTAVRVRFGEVEATAKVVWRSEHHAGLQFAAPLAGGLGQTAGRPIDIFQSWGAGTRPSRRLS